MLPCLPEKLQFVELSAGPDYHRFYIIPVQQSVGLVEFLSKKMIYLYHYENTYKSDTCNTSD